MEEQYKFPCKVQFSAEGMKALRSGRKNRIGRALRISQRGTAIDCIVVQWDGTKTIGYYHKDFIELIAN